MVAVEPVMPAPGRQRFSDDGLLDAALELFHAHGYQSAQMSELARSAGTTKPTLYARLGGKEQIYVRVLEREAGMLTDYLVGEYSRAADRSLHDAIQIATLAFFQYAEQRPEGFALLFRNDPGGPGGGITERMMNEVTRHIAGLVRGYLKRSGRRPGPSSELLAAGAVGVARGMCEYAVSARYDLDAAGTLATAFAEAAFRGIDPRALRRADRR